MNRIDLTLIKDWLFYAETINDKDFWRKDPSRRASPEIAKWYAFEGDYIKQGERLCQIESGHYMGPRGPDIICPIEGKVIERTTHISLGRICGNILVTIETPEVYSSQEIRELQRIMIKDVTSARDRLNRGFFHAFFDTDLSV